jgi:hypothetical protein
MLSYVGKRKGEVIAMRRERERKRDWEGGKEGDAQEPVNNA